MDIICKDKNGNELTKEEIEKIIIENKICNEIIATTKSKISGDYEG